LAHQVFDIDATEPGHGRGRVRLLDPRARVVVAAVFSVAIVGLEGFVPLGLALVLSVLLMMEAGLPPLRTMKRVAMMDSFIIFMLLMLPFTMPGDEIFSVWGYPASQQGLEKAIRIGLKANAVVLMAMTLVGTMEPVILGHALYRLKVPENLVLLLLFTVRYIDVIHEEYQALRRSMKVRGFQSKANMHSYRMFGYLVGMMLVRAMERSERIMQAMKCRGFVGRFEILDTLRFRFQDAVFFVAMVVLVGAIYAVEYGYVPIP
jgi:cobalt/nickel transport system permease protein